MNENSFSDQSGLIHYILAFGNWLIILNTNNFKIERTECKIWHSEIETFIVMYIIYCLMQ